MSFDIYDVCIIGAGASGMIAAIESSRRGLSAVVMEKNRKPGRKLYATGNGRCNITNLKMDETYYFSLYNKPFDGGRLACDSFVEEVYGVLAQKTGVSPAEFIESYFGELGLSLRNHDGYVYPASMQASSVVWALTDMLRHYGVEIRCGETATSIEYTDDIYIVTADTGTVIRSRSLILAAGSPAGSGVGAATSPEIGKLLNCLGVNYVPFKPCLCPMSTDTDISRISGVRARCVVSLYSSNGELFCSEEGEVNFTDYGISGIVIFNLTCCYTKDCYITLNLIPEVSRDAFTAATCGMREKSPERRTVALLNGYINDKLAAYIVDNTIGETGTKIGDISSSDIEALYDACTSLRFDISGTGGFDKSQSSLGGVLTENINACNMQVVYPDAGNLYITGELLDVAGKCGGYNLTFAFITGYLAGNGVLR